MTASAFFITQGKMSKHSKTDTIIYIKCNDPEYFGGAESIAVALPRKRLFIPQKSMPYKTMTFGEEVDSLVKEWYAARGQPVPPEDLVGGQIDIAQAQQAAEIELAFAKHAAESPAVAPPYGTPEFWAYHRAKKEAENQRRAAEGLPPLPTKKELEATKAAAKVAKDAAKVAKDAEKAAKAAAKATKEAEKAAKAATKAMANMKI